ncbi:MAG: hypothetical protein HY939_04435 [Gammaproteobacteria bacterium]|nr:hypothetical protein [Gammaproteobacteria bacterium]
MSLCADVTVESFLRDITEPDGTLNLAILKKLGGGGTHDIYKSEKHPELLLKVMRDTIGHDRAELSEHLQTLGEQCAVLYETFGSSRCIVEERSIQSLKLSDANDSPKIAIVSVVPFDPCFESKEKFGFNVKSAELDGILIESKRYLYGKINRSLLGNAEDPSPYVMRNYPLLNKTFESIFKLLDTDESLVVAMREFLTKYKSFYQKTGILLDTIGFDNVLFYKVEDVWQFKLGSVIKHDTGALTKKMLDEMTQNPAAATQSFKAFTSIYFMPACIRALNACAAKVGMEKIVDDIILDEKISNALAKIHLQLEKSSQIINYAEHGKFVKALELYRHLVPDGKSDETELRDFMGTLYWDYIKKGGEASSREEVDAYLKILRDERNTFPEFRQAMVKEAIEGLEYKILSIDRGKSATFHKRSSSQIQFFDPRTKRPDESDKQFVSRLGRQVTQNKKY